MPEPGPRSPVHRRARIAENRLIARDTYRLRLLEPDIGASIRAGQFVMIRPGDGSSSDPLLGRPLALYDVVRDAQGRALGIDVVYLVIGRGTAALSRRREGEEISVWGPLGNGFGPPPAGSAVLVAGGIGQTPFLALARDWLQAGASPCTSLTLLYGVRTAALLAGVDDFLAAGVAVEVATDDGTAGHHGFVTELLARRLAKGERPPRVVGCGPPGMLAALSRIAAHHGIDCDVSLENHMACGFGACFSCVAPIRQPDGSTDLKRVCVEGPVFAASDVAWS